VWVTNKGLTTRLRGGELDWRQLAYLPIPGRIRIDLFKKIAKENMDKDSAVKDRCGGKRSL